jgi:hypothetical protein
MAHRRRRPACPRGRFAVIGCLSPTGEITMGPGKAPTSESGGIRTPEPLRISRKVSSCRDTLR